MIGKRYRNDIVRRHDRKGLLCNCVYIMEQLDIDKELYVEILLDEYT